MKQKDIFLGSEGDAWLERNQAALARRRLPDEDPVLSELLSLPGIDKKMCVLEIGCGDGARLGWLKENRGSRCSGIDPSAQSVTSAKQHGIRAIQGTADQLPFEAGEFDLVIFGFCLYLCDRDDLFRIAQEADRVLRTPGWLVINDFYSPAPISQAYKHRPGLFSHKMDYRELFSWNPSYTCMTHKVRHHQDANYSDQPDEWVAVSVMRKTRASEDT